MSRRTQRVITTFVIVAAWEATFIALFVHFGTRIGFILGCFVTLSILVNHIIDYWLDKL
jgi:hypothetical protein